MEKKAASKDGEPAAKKARVAVAKKGAAAKLKAKKKKKVSPKVKNKEKPIKKTGKGKPGTKGTTEYRVSKVTGMRKRGVCTSAGKKESITEYELW